MLLWFFIGFCGVLVANGMIGVIAKKHITKFELLMFTAIFLLGPVGFTLAVLTLAVKWMIEIDDNPNITIFDWRPKTKAIECPRCAHFYAALPVDKVLCPNCGEVLLR